MISLLLNVILSVVCVALYQRGKLDSSTRLLNKQQFNQDVQQLKRLNDVVVIIDIDKFKHINDTMGHKYGDEVIALVSKTIKNDTRSSDRAYRIGGDEFATITNDNSVGQRIKDDLASFDVSVSVGCGKTYEEADKAMYENKFTDTLR